MWNERREMRNQRGVWSVVEIWFCGSAIDRVSQDCAQKGFIYCIGKGITARMEDISAVRGKRVESAS